MDVLVGDFYRLFPDVVGFSVMSQGGGGIDVGVDVVSSSVMSRGGGGVEVGVEVLWGLGGSRLIVGWCEAGGGVGPIISFFQLVIGVTPGMVLGLGGTVGESSASRNSSISMSSGS